MVIVACVHHGGQGEDESGVVWAAGAHCCVPCSLSRLTGLRTEEMVAPECPESAREEPWGPELAPVSTFCARRMVLRRLAAAAAESPL